MALDPALFAQKNVLAFSLKRRGEISLFLKYFSLQTFYSQAIAGATFAIWTTAILLVNVSGGLH